VRIDLLSREYPPEVYGGAGVHVAELVRALRASAELDVRVRCFGSPRDEAGTTAYADAPGLAGAADLPHNSRIAAGNGREKDGRGK